MVKFLGDQNQFSFQYESGTYASTSGARQWLGLVQEHTADESTNVIQVRYQGSTDRNVDVFQDGNLDFTGTFSYFPQDWKFLGFAIGSIAETGSATTGSHVFVENNTDDRVVGIANIPLTSFTLEDAKNNGTAGLNFIRTYTGGMVDSFTLTATQGEVVSCEVGYMAQSEAFSSGAVTGVTAVTTAPIMFNEVQLQIPSGTVIDNVMDMSLSINNNLQAGHYLNGSRVLKETLPLNRDMELTATVAMDSSNAKTFYDTYFIGGTTFNAQIQTIGAAGSAFITLSGCKLEDMDNPSPVEGVNEQSLTIIPRTISATVLDDIDNYNIF